ncbi:hypothetical protein AJ80_09862 [Polytolypa hystricis UAMH7299]|uniref:OTU domain-containing protein n=1 Tax=Polytolypa hystricis (strain UAMH7299) TaxID=1447883 RepID=A0A2B7WI32_POLH7|nr:hypothetical protein AJ80_09862 [Polytolypa hystricis UAMH7299]
MESPTPLEELQARHRKEQRDLQSRITQKKKSATKKTRKGVNDECEKLQRELSENQQAEIARLNGGEEEEEEEEEAPDVNLDDLTLDDGEGQDQVKQNGEPQESKTTVPTSRPSTTSPPLETNRPKKPNRQKARLARRAAEQEAEAARAAEEATKQTDHRGNERKTMDDTFLRLKLKETEIRPDGHCLYSAIATQLVDIGVALTPSVDGGDINEKDLKAKPNGYRTVRDVTSSFLLAHSDDFAPFIEEPLPEYARKIRSTAEWGGQLELQAIARAYGVHINVVQGGGRIEKFEPGGEVTEEGKKQTIWLAYYRHTYGLGEHYNALSQSP